MNKGWKIGRVGELIDSLESGISVNGEDGTPSNDDYAVLKVSAVTYGKFNPKASKRITGSELRRAKCTPKKGQIIISRSNTPDFVGASCYVTEDYPNRFLPDKLWQTVPHPDKEVEHKWLAYFLASPWARFRLSKLATGTSNSMKNITKSELMTLPVQIPPFLEQKRIASFLECWDNAIEKTEVLIAAKEKQFEWLCQMYFKPGNTINSEWKKHQIKSFVRTRNEREVPSDEAPLYSLTIENGVTAKTDRYNREFLVTDKEVKKYKIVYPQDIVFNPANLRWGAIARSEVEHKVTVSPIYEVLKVNTSKIDSDFLTHALTCSRQISIFSTMVEGTLVERMAVKIDTFLNCHIYVPNSQEEQKRIAQVLNLSKKEINLLKNTLEQYRIQKHGLMQKLLTGEWQVGGSHLVTEDMYQEEIV
ncbi:restriction endonuclease subunit S [Acinetobacter sp. YH12054]|uniref:restriction endonuclease subunit S n=1 Tax=Acinetobacter sp. YH12054 TaxID=2601056 RepID=UPI0015D3CF2B|nr:restriction endonuclease subunit S [Acinetobacter sp. YH12054]